MNYDHLKAKDFVWKKNELGFDVVRFQASGVIMSIVRAHKGDKLPQHSHSKGAFMYVIKGSIHIEGDTLNEGDAGYCRPGPGYYAADCDILEDSIFIFCRSEDDVISQ